MNETGNQRDIVMCGVINDEMARHVIVEIQRECYTRETELRLFIDSSGGSMPIASALAHILLSAFPNLTTYNLSSVKSSAMYLYLCGGKRICYPEGSFMMHPAAVECRMSQMDAAALREHMQSLEMDTESAVRFYQSRTGIESKCWREWFSRQTLMSAQEALEKGIVTDVIDNIEPIRQQTCMIYG